MTRTDNGPSNEATKIVVPTDNQQTEPVTTDEPFGGCPKCGQCDEVRSFGRTDWGSCSKHMTKWWAGENVRSSWREENWRIWEENAIELHAYEEVKPIYPEGGPQTPHLGISIDFTEHGRADEAKTIIEVLFEEAARSSLRLDVYETIHISHIFEGYLAQFDFDDHREALRFIVLLRTTSPDLRLVGRDKHHKLIYEVMKVDRFQKYTFVGQLDDVEAFLDAQRENHLRCCADCAALRQSRRHAAVAVANEVILKMPKLVDDVEMDQR